MEKTMLFVEESFMKNMEIVEMGKTLLKNGFDFEKINEADFTLYSDYCPGEQADWSSLKMITSSEEMETAITNFCRAFVDIAEDFLRLDESKTYRQDFLGLFAAIFGEEKAKLIKVGGKEAVCLSVAPSELEEVTNKIKNNEIRIISFLISYEDEDSFINKTVMERIQMFKKGNEK